MYLRKIDGRRAVQLPDGSSLTRADLPKADTCRWVASRKAILVKAVAYGLVSQQEILETYGLSEEEFEGWKAAFLVHGEGALRTTRLQIYRQL